jgi:hypothetical protein
VTDWPGDDPSAIALAARIAMLSAAAQTCPVSDLSPDEALLMALILKATSTANVNGHSFAEFLSSAKETVTNAVTDIELATLSPGTLLNIETCRAEDLIGAIFSELVVFSSRFYESVCGEGFNPSLKRQVVRDSSRTRRFVAGAVPSKRDEVYLILYSGFDLAALALTPYILAHELICHVGARHSGLWERAPDPDVRDYFSDGFMDRAARYLLMTWLHELSVLTPAGHLAEEDISYESERPHIFRAGAAAWRNCEVELRSRLRGRRQPGTSVATDLASRGAISLNASPEDVTGKDRFVYFARTNRPNILAAFASLALGRATPSDLLVDALKESFPA